MKSVFRSSFFVHYIQAFIVLNVNPPRWELCFLPPIRVDSFNCSIREHPPLVLWRVNLSLPISKLHHLFPMLWYLDNSSIWKNALLSTVGVENLDRAIWEGYLPCTIRMVFFSLVVWKLHNLQPRRISWACCSSIIIVVYPSIWIAGFLSYFVFSGLGCHLCIIAVSMMINQTSLSALCNHGIILWTANGKCGILSQRVVCAFC